MKTDYFTIFWMVLNTALLLAILAIIVLILKFLIKRLK